MEDPLFRRRSCRQRRSRGKKAGGGDIFITQIVLPATSQDCNANDDGAVAIADAIAVLSHLFAGSGDLSEPVGDCGDDPLVDQLGCSSFPPCE